MNDTRIAHIRQDVAAAQACLDDARTALVDLLEENPPLTALEAADIGAARDSINRALFKSRNAFAALSRLEDRQQRAASKRERTAALVRGPW